MRIAAKDHNCWKCGQVIAKGALYCDAEVVNVGLCAWPSHYGYHQECMEEHDKMEKIMVQMKAKPKKPNRRLDMGAEMELSGFNGQTLQEVIVWLGLRGAQPDDVKCYGDRLVFDMHETEADYKERLKAYQVRLKEWKEWADENADAITQMKQRQIEGKQKRMDELQAEIDAINEKMR